METMDDVKREGDLPFGDGPATDSRPMEKDPANESSPGPVFVVRLCELTKRQMRGMLAQAWFDGALPMVDSPAEIKAAAKAACEAARPACEPHKDLVDGKLVEVESHFDPSKGAEWLARQADRWFHEAMKFIKSNGDLGKAFMEGLEKIDAHAERAENYRNMLDTEKARSEGLLKQVAEFQGVENNLRRVIAGLEGIISEGRKANQKQAAELARGHAEKAALMGELKAAEQAAADKLAAYYRASAELVEFKRLAMQYEGEIASLKRYAPKADAAE